MGEFSRLRGVKDICPPESLLWEHIIRRAFAAMKIYGYSLISTPVIEELKLFSRSVGEATDIVIKEMYSFQDKKGRDIALRPEGTASVARAYIENSLPEKSNLFYMGQMFRYEKPQKGRDREFYQIGAESYGDATPYKDAEIIKLAYDVLKIIGITSGVLHINNLGSKEIQAEYSKKLLIYLKENIDGLCPDCEKKMERSPMRVLDCKNDKCAPVIENAPRISESADKESTENFKRIKELLNKLKVKYVENPALVRGLDYYTGTVFEFITDKLGPQQNTLLAGGRYDNLIKELGKKDVPATGFALGIERVAEVLKAEGNAGINDEINVYIVTGKGLIEKGFEILDDMHENGISAVMSFEEKSFKAQMREANSRHAGFAVIIGEEEAAASEATVKQMSTGEQQRVKLNQLTPYIKGLK